MLFHQKQVEYFPIIRNSHTIMQITACFTKTTSKAGTKINCRRNRNEVKIESRQNGSRQNWSRRNGRRRNGNTPVLSRVENQFWMFCPPCKICVGCFVHPIKTSLGSFVHGIFCPTSESSLGAGHFVGFVVPRLNFNLK